MNSELQAATLHRRRFLGCRRPLLAGAGVAVLCAGITLFMPNKYRSEVKILPVDNKVSGGLSQLADVAAMFGSGMPGQDSDNGNYVDILKSRRIREQLLTTEFQYFIPRQGFWRRQPLPMRRQKLMDYLKVRDSDEGLDAMKKVIQISRDLKTKTLTIGVETHSPTLSQAVARLSTELLETYLIETAQTRGSFKAAFALERLQDGRKDVDAAEEDLRRFMDANRNFMASGDATIHLKGLRLQNELALRQQLVTTLAMNREQALLEAKNDVPILNVLDPANLPIHKSGPGRALLVLASFFFTALGLALFENWKILKTRLFDHDDPGAPTTPRAGE
jgi:uncharacterized protein involved in exopolysaccharide biosynthesis